MAWNIKTLNLVYFISFLDLFAIGLTFPLFSTHLREIGASHSTIGLLTSTYSGIQVISGPLIGGWSDVRDRKSVLISTLCLCSVGYVLLGLTNSILVTFVIRIFLGIFKHTQSICKAVICDLVPANEQAGAFGRSAALGSIGFIIGPFLGGHISELKNGFTYVCLITSVTFIINIVIATKLPSPTKKKPNGSLNLNMIKQEFAKTVHDLTAINWKIHWDSFLLRFLFGLAVTTYLSNQSMFLKEKFDLSQRHMGYTISFFSTVGTGSAFFLSHINRFYKKDNSCFLRLFHFFMLMTISLVAIFVTPSLVLFLVLLVPFSICATVLRVVSMELMIKKSGNTQRGSFSGASNSVMSISRVIMPLITGFVGDLFGENVVILTAALPALVGTMLCYFLGKNVDVKRTKVQ